MDKWQEIEQILTSNNIYAEVYPMSKDTVAVEISWGDWKHEHLRTKWLLAEAGYEHLVSAVTEEDGSDTYSAIHYFK